MTHTLTYVTYSLGINIDDIPFSFFEKLDLGCVKSVKSNSDLWSVCNLMLICVIGVWAVNIRGEI